MTPEQALRSIQAEMTSPDWIWCLGEFEKLLANTPAEDLEREVNNVAHCLMLTLKRTAPQMSEAMQYSLPYSFSRLLLERMRAKGRRD
jgi:hypothetical protein